MSSRVLIPILIATCYVAEAQSTNLELARQLSQSSSRANAVAEIVSRNDGAVPLLLSWTETPPMGIDVYELDVGLADAFAQLKTKEAIPFLIKNLGLNRDHAPNVWRKAPEVVERILPCAAALVRIGPDAARAVIRAYWEPMPAEDRPAAIFVVTRVLEVHAASVPEANAFLQSALGELSIESRLAESGLKALGRRDP